MRVAGAAVAVGLIALLVYAATLCPTVYVGDCGELTWAAASLGIAHQPGYPLWTVLGRVAVSMAPGDPAVTLNATSALFAAGAAALFSVLLALVTGRVFVSAGMALAFAFSRGVWSQATIAEVYALNLLATVAALACAYAGWRGRPRWFLLSAYLLGLGAANHPLVLAAAPAAAWLAGARWREARFVVLAGSLFVLGLSAYLYLPFRWSAGPEMNWGGIRSLGEIWDHVTRAQYGGLGEAGADTSVALRLRVFAEILARSVPGLLLVVAGFGLVHALRAGRALGGMLVVLLVVAGPVIATAIRYEDTFLDRSVASVFFLPAVLGAFLAAGMGVGALDRLAQERLRGEGRIAVLVTGLLALAPPIALHQSNVAGCDRSESVLGARYARSVLESLPPGARLYALGDNSTFLFAWAQQVEGVRPDITLCDRSLNLFVRAYGEDFPAMSRRERRQRAIPREVERAFGERDTPVFYTEEVELEPFGECRFAPAGLVNQLLRPGETPGRIRQDRFELPPIDREEFLEVHLAGVVLYREGRWLLQEGRPEEALECFLAAADVAAGIAPILRNLGLEHLAAGDPITAEERFLAAVALEPDNEDALYNLAILYGMSGRLEESIEYFERIIAFGTEYAEVYLNLGLQLVRAGRLEEAASLVEEALVREPDLPPALTAREAIRRGLAIGGEAGALEARRAIEPLTTGGTLQLAERYLERGDVERASELYREAYQKAPESADACYGLGYGLLRLGRAEEAADAFRRVLELEPEGARGRNALAYVFALTGDSLRTAERLAKEALELDASLAAYWYDTLGWVLYRAGRFSEALEALTRAAETLPGDDLSMRAENDYHLGAVLMAMERAEDAKVHLARSLARATSEPWVPDLKARARELGLEVRST